MFRAKIVKIDIVLEFSIRNSKIISVKILEKLKEIDSVFK